MTERTQINDVAARELRPYGRWSRVEHAYEAGWPDVAYTLLGVTGWVECKLVLASGRCPPTFTREQLLWGESETAVGGLWHLLGVRPLPDRGREWWLLDAAGARAWFEGGREPAARFRVIGPFPTASALGALAPRDRRTKVWTGLPPQSTSGT